MIQFDFEQFCTGCSSCYNICPTEAIQMIANHDGFLMPYIDSSKCIDCKKCEKSCPYLTVNNKPIESFKVELEKRSAYLYFSYGNARKNSASGGVFYELAMNWIQQGGYVCGCIWSDNMTAKHIITNDEREIKKMQGSKYVQSTLGNCFNEIKRLLQSKNKVLFSGTPCQTAGLYANIPPILRKGLFVVSIICHGVPSPLVWKKYKQHLEHKYESKMVDVNMRDKSYKGYSMTYCKYSFKEQEKKESVYAWPTYLADPYVFLLTDNLFLRNSCYSCKYKVDNTFSDLIIGDFHPSVKEAGELGCNTVITLTEKGRNMIEVITGYKRLVNSNYVSKINSMLWKAAENCNRRDQFFEVLHSSDASIKTFTKFLPFRFHLKKLLNEIRMLKFVIKIIRWIK